MPDKATSRRSCIFCGSAENKITKEHVWSDWLRNELPADVLEREFTYVVGDTVTGREYRVPGQPLFDRRVSGVCNVCNEQWMSDVEGRVQDVVTGMLHGRRRHLHEGGQIAIATWANLKALVAQMGFRQPEGQVPREHYREVHRWAADEQPPPLTTVYTAKAGWSMGVAQPGFFRLNGINKGGDPGDKDNGYIAAFSALDLVVVVVRLLWDERAEFNFSPRLAPSVRRIWPPTDSFIWPPGPALTDAGIAALAGGPQGPDA